MGVNEGAAAAAGARPRPIEILRVAGTHHDVGRQIGEACADVVRASTDLEGSARPPEGRTLGQQMDLARRYLEVTRNALPWLVEELDGCAAGAGVDPLALFAASIEELWSVRPSQAPAAPRGAQGRCSDLVATPPATAGDRLLVAHNNDLSPGSEPQIVAIEWDVPGDPRVFTLGIGPWISVGWNAAGLSLTGNELTPNDERIGVPRLLMVREQVRTRTLADAAAAALRPDRASSYNTVFVHRDAGALNVEGSATDAETTGPGPDGTLAHTNHYVCDRMRAREGDPAYARRSAVRYGRAAELLAEAAASPGSITADALRGMLSDHRNAPDSICRHPVEGSDEKTVFWCVADVSAGAVRFGRGNPCRSDEQEYAFAHGA